MRNDGVIAGFGAQEFSEGKILFDLVVSYCHVPRYTFDSHECSVTAYCTRLVMPSSSVSESIALGEIRICRIHGIDAPDKTQLGCSVTKNVSF